MSSALEKAFSLIEYLAQNPHGSSVSSLSEALGQPASGIHRSLKMLEELGYVRQLDQGKHYALTIKLSALGLSYLGGLGLNDVTQPILDKLAEQTEELIRMAIIDGEDLVWVGVSQGTKSGLKYDPSSEQGQTAHLASSASGIALLATMSDEEAVSKVMKQGLSREGQGSGAPMTIQQLLDVLGTTRKRGYSINCNSFLDGMAAMARVIYDPVTGKPFGTVSIAGPAVRLTKERMDTFEKRLESASKELSEASRASNYFKHLEV
ncbi:MULTISPECIES: IclR family transcriptional regulator [unclassified Marinobacterium]|uniref:IclR family transcriptional regulator n=1 Tax=unclassified Marinobacterium TaxID=2644139 RepID=UPI00156A4808|nr:MULTISPECIES: IclR family transcriptional regulator [unclassified Marinobacterium]NRP27478.1 Acetate operon repressor [Marinobacterium sp. xm-d-420]NRP52367.1 Acetate operon repressor [Marinobacterium sp. xm-v-242]NRP76948.1 Acetate operon repressor [Marinobacterium sp. xm-m-383]